MPREKVVFELRPLYEKYVRFRQAVHTTFTEGTEDRAEFNTRTHARVRPTVSSSTT